VRLSEVEDHVNETIRQWHRFLLRFVLVRSGQGQDFGEISLRFPRPSIGLTVQGPSRGCARQLYQRALLLRLNWSDSPAVSLEEKDFEVEFRHMGTNAARFKIFAVNKNGQLDLVRPSVEVKGKRRRVRASGLRRASASIGGYLPAMQ